MAVVMVMVMVVLVMVVVVVLVMVVMVVGCAESVFSLVLSVLVPRFV